jgi:ParB family chromosome partitioning protein
MRRSGALPSPAWTDAPSVTGKESKLPELQRSTLIEYRSPQSLKPHPFNVEIYGEDGYEDLVDSIRQLGIQEPLHIKGDGTIISGHRRHKAAMIANCSSIPCVVVAYGSALDEQEAIIEFNRQRIKNGQVLFNEGMAKERIAAERARGRQVEAGKLYHEGSSKPKHEVVEILPQALKPETKTRDIVARDIGLGSGKQWDKLKAIGKAKPESLAKIHAGGQSINAVYKEVRDIEVTRERAEFAKLSEAIKPDERWNVWQADINDWQPPRKYDFIITDPPYPKEYLPLYEVLAKKATTWLNDSGLLVVMCG